MKQSILKVQLCAQTALTEEFFATLYDTEFYDRETHWNLLTSDPDLLCEAAGRICYDSFDLPREATRHNQDYLANIRRQLHFSVLEHASFTFYIGGVSRALLAELTRHRHHSWSVRSQRYVDESDADWVAPPWLAEKAAESPDAAYALATLQVHHEESRRVYRILQNTAVEMLGANRKTANDIARYALPEGTETELYATGNGRAWMELLNKRTSSGAALEIRRLADSIYLELVENAPGIFKDLTNES